MSTKQVLAVIAAFVLATVALVVVAPMAAVQVADAYIDRVTGNVSVAGPEVIVSNNAVATSVRSVAEAVERLDAATRLLSSRVEALELQQADFRSSVDRTRSAADSTASRMDSIEPNVVALGARLEKLEEASAQIVTSLDRVVVQQHAADLAMRTLTISADGTKALVSELLVAQRELKGSVDRALGQVVVVEPNPEIDARLDALMSIWLPDVSPSSIPGLSDDLRSELDILEESVSEGQNLRVASRIYRLRWWADVLDLLENPPETLAAVPSMVEHASDLALRSPIRAPLWAVTKIQEFRRRVAFQAARMAHDEALAVDAGYAQSIMLVEEALDTPLSATDRALAREWLRELMDRQRIASESLPSSPIQAALGDLSNRRAVAKKIESPDLRIQTLAGLDAQLVNLILEAKSDSERVVVESMAAQAQAETAQIAAAMREQAVMEYQRYAFKMIERFEIKKEENDSSRGLAAALEECLLSLDRSLLDPVLGRKVGELWDSAFDELDDDDRQRILRQSALLPKRRIGEVGVK